MTFDCFTFFNELDLLELRFRELSPVVDYFVLVESPLRFSGKTKPLFYRESQDRFKEWRKKIIHVVVKNPDQGANPWVREEQQRNCILSGLTKAKENDLVLISDIDEIISASCLVDMGQWLVKQDYPIHLAQRHFLHYLNLRRVLDWYMPVAGTAKVVRRIGGAHSARMAQIKFGHILPEAGWHFAYQGGLAKVVDKMESFSHCREADCIELREKYRTGAMIPEINDGLQLKNIQIDLSYPDFIRHNLGWWSERGYIK